MSAPLTDLDWFAQNDTVMGGVSDGKTAPLDDGLVRFAGELSLESNGGFVSVRSRVAELDLEEARGLRLVVRGDGRTWSVNAYRSDVPIRAGSYRRSFATKEGENAVVTVEFADFAPTSFGRPVAGAPALDAKPERINQLGFLLADKQPGPFVLDVVSIEAHGTARARASSPNPLYKRLEAALTDGVPAYNTGNVDDCRDLYASALKPMVGDDRLTEGEQRVVQDALAAAAKEAAKEAAWTLRGAIDTVLASAEAQE